MNDTPNPTTILTSAQMQRMEREIDREIQTRLGTYPDNTTLQRAFDANIEETLGKPPTKQSLEASGYHETFLDQATLWIVKALQGAGRITSWLVAEFLQSWAALIIGTVFALLEYDRVQSGAITLGQTEQQAQLIAIAVVVANVIHPIYTLRQHRTEAANSVIKRRHNTLAGSIRAFWRRISGDPWTEDINVNHNRTLDVAAMVITWGTIIIAIYDLLGPLLWQIFAPQLMDTEPSPPIIMILELLIGLALSLAGVYFLQSAAHEIGVRTLTEQSVSLEDLLKEKAAQYELERRQRWQHALSDLPNQQDEYRRQVAAIRTQIKNQYMQAALADKARKVSQGKAQHGQLVLPELREPELTVHSGNHNGAGTGTKRA